MGSTKLTVLPGLFLDFENVIVMILAVTLTKISASAIIIPVFMKGARFMQISVFVCVDIVRLAPYTLTR